MAHQVLTTEYVSVNAVDLSSHVVQATLTYEAEAVDQTTMGSGTKQFLGGLKNWTLEVEFAQDWAASQVDATLFPLVGTAVTVEVRPTNAARSATNPGYSGTGLIARYVPISGRVGALAGATLSVQPAGTLQRLTA